jgi:sugar phosphate isomerase/epimerase
MIKFGTNTNPALDPFEELQLIASHKFDFAELSVEEPFADHEILMKNRKKIEDILKKQEIFLYAHAPPWVDLGNLNEKVRNVWIEESKNILYVCSKIGAKNVNFHAFARSRYLRNKKTKKMIMDNSIRSFTVLSKFAENLGIDITLENSWEDVSDMKYFLKKIPYIKFNLDVGHAFIKGKMPLIMKYIKELKKGMVHTHFHDNRGQFDEHLAVGKGDIDFEKICKEMKRIKYDSTITLEVFKSKNEAEKSMNRIRGMMR